MRSIEPGIHWTSEQVLEWIPDSHCERAGMTVVAARDLHQHMCNCTNTRHLILPQPAATGP
jgi:hypothetical protein